MGVGRVCSIHNEWCADGNCRWCEPLADAPLVAVIGQSQMNGQELQQAFDDCWARLGQVNQQAQQWTVYTPNANATATTSSFSWTSWGLWPLTGWL